MWNVIHCATQGRGHIKEGIPCQDKTFYVVKNNVTVAALADGAGSATMSHYGAEVITRELSLYMSESFDKFYNQVDGVAVKKDIMSEIDNILYKESKRLNCDVKELASTLLLVALKDDRLIIIHIGDGVIGYLRNNELKVASEPENGEFVNTTVFTTSYNAIAAMKLIKSRVNNICGFVLMSDGTEVSLYDKINKKISDGIKKIIGSTYILPYSIVQEMLQNSMDSIIKQATIDDCSLVIMTRENEQFSGYRDMTIRQKCALLKLRPKSMRKMISRYDKILIYTKKPKNIKQISEHIYLEPKYVRKHMDKLLRLNFIAKVGSCYQTIIKMDKLTPIE